LISIRFILVNSMRFRFHFVDVNGRAIMVQLSRSWEDKRENDDWISISGGTRGKNPFWIIVKWIGLSACL